MNVRQVKEIRRTNIQRTGDLTSNDELVIDVFLLEDRLDLLPKYLEIALGKRCLK